MRDSEPETTQISGLTETDHTETDIINVYTVVKPPNLGVIHHTAINNYYKKYFSLIWSNEDLWCIRRAPHPFCVDLWFSWCVWSLFWQRLWVGIRGVPYVNYLQAQPYEQYRGTGCPVIRGLLDFFEVLYFLSLCVASEIGMPMRYSHGKFNHMWTSEFRYQRSYPHHILYSKKVFILCGKKWKGKIAIRLRNIEKANKKGKLNIISRWKNGGSSSRVIWEEFLPCWTAYILSFPLWRRGQAINL